MAFEEESPRPPPPGVSPRPPPPGVTSPTNRDAAKTGVRHLETAQPEDDELKNGSPNPRRVASLDRGASPGDANSPSWDSMKRKYDESMKRVAIPLKGPGGEDECSIS